MMFLHLGHRALEELFGFRPDELERMPVRDAMILQREAWRQKHVSSRAARWQPECPRTPDPAIPFSRSMSAHTLPGFPGRRRRQ